MGKTAIIITFIFFLLGVGHVQAGSDEARERTNAGVKLLQQGKTDEAVTEFEKAVTLDPDYVAAHVNLAYAYDRQGRVEEAMDGYRRVIELAPEDVMAHNNLGVLYDKKGLYNEAIGAFEQALRIDPTNANAQKNLENAKKNKATIQGRQDRIAQAQKEVEDHPTSPRASYKLARLYAFYGKKDQAIEWLDKALKMGFNDLDYLKADPALKDLRDDPSFARLLKAR
ncbi:MAG: tetratricopeptide repeat protein [Candidatus Binatia bacterium]